MVSGCFSLYMHTNVYMYRRDYVYARYTHLSANLFGYLLKTHWKNNDKFISLSRPGSQFLEYKICIKSFFALTVGTCSLQAEGFLVCAPAELLGASGIGMSLCLPKSLCSHKPCDSHVGSFTSHRFHFSSKPPVG